MKFDEYLEIDEQMREIDAIFYSNYNLWDEPLIVKDGVILQYISGFENICLPKLYEFMGNYLSDNLIDNPSYYIQIAKIASINFSKHIINFDYMILRFSDHSIENQDLELDNLNKMVNDDINTDVFKVNGILANKIPNGWIDYSIRSILNNCDIEQSGKDMNQYIQKGINNEYTFSSIGVEIIKNDIQNYFKFPDENELDLRIGHKAYVSLFAKND
ncbi:MAG: hypothetical protein LBO69_05240 [Ignavibacteria bacterium]|jgi:hypothetical protein|nr:hypothetical protein [Ignavibacteria bacterium]